MSIYTQKVLQMVRQIITDPVILKRPTYDHVHYLYNKLSSHGCEDWVVNGWLQAFKNTTVEVNHFPPSELNVFIAIISCYNYQIALKLNVDVELILQQIEADLTRYTNHCHPGKNTPLQEIRGFVYNTKMHGIGGEVFTTAFNTTYTILVDNEYYPAVPWALVKVDYKHRARYTRKFVEMYYSNCELSMIDALRKTVAELKEDCITWTVI